MHTLHSKHCMRQMNNVEVSTTKYSDVLIAKQLFQFSQKSDRTSAQMKASVETAA